jgi:methyltransferase-like protein/trans-aconitate methyltransferase
MPDPTRTAYDEVLYPSAVYIQTHIDRLAAMATLFGMSPTPVERCRVLELGCGDGTNLIAMALGLPGSQFVGIDLASQAIAKGRATLEAIRLSNVSLHALDVMQAPADLGSFDFIIAHGLYSWVPAEVRDRIMAICSRHLSACGVAYVSYNAYPGNHARDMVRGMMRYHVAQFSEPAEQIRQARSLLKFLSESKEEPDVYHALLKRELERTLTYPDAGFYHDDLSPINHPVYFHEFMAHAARHGLQYIAEADVLDMKEDKRPPQVAAVLAALDGGDVVAREQYRDFLRCRAFRQTLLCHKAVQLDRAPKPERIRDLYIAAEVKMAVPGGDVRSDSPVLFLGPKGAEIETNRPLVKTAFARLSELWPCHTHFRELLAFVRSHLGRSTDAQPASMEDETRDLSQALLQAHLAGFVELHTTTHKFAGAASERPVASPLARLQLREGGISVSSMRHNVLKIEDVLGRHLVMLLDGTRDRAALLAELGALVKTGAVTVCHDGKPVTDPQESLQRLAGGLETNLASLARLALLVG